MTLIRCVFYIHDREVEWLQERFLRGAAAAGAHGARRRSAPFRQSRERGQGVARRGGHQTAAPRAGKMPMAQWHGPTI